MGTTKRHLQAAQGYVELGMFQEAWNELEELPPTDRAGVEVLAIRIAILNAMDRYEMAAEIARDAVKRFPDTPELYTSGAYAIRRAETVRAAFEFLSSGHLCMDEETPMRPMFWFNMGCYHAQMGNRNDALDCVIMAVEIAPKYAERALSEPDLEELREELKVELG